MDFGCRVDGYCSDITRTVSFGAPSDDFRAAYDSVREAMQTASGGAHPGTSGRSVDGIARRLLQDRGLGDYFAHGLGHGVGLDIHEAPRVSHAADSTIPGGAVITMEPGVYIPDQYGIRIENMVHVTDSGPETLNALGTDLIIL